MKCKKLWSQARFLTFPKKLVALGIVILLITPVSGYGQIYLSDHFDSQSDWNGCSDPPAPWDGYFYNESKYCNNVKIKDIRIWYDGGELNWNGNNLNADFGGNSFDSGGGGGRLLFGYQARPEWGSGNVSYFDDTIVASTKEEVESFLGTTNGGVGGDDPVEPSNTGLPYSDGFESGNFNSWDGTHGDVSVVTTNPKAGSYCARARLSQGTTSDNYVDFYYGEKDGKDPVTEIYWQGYSKFDSGYVWPNNAQKIVVHNIYDSQGTKDYQIIVAVNSNGQYYVEHTYWQSWDFFGKAQNQGSPISVSFGQWDKLKLRAKLNTPGNSDGVIQLWINDTLKLSYTNLNIRENTQDTFGKMILSSNSNESSGSNSYQWYDDWSISGTSDGGPIGSAPAAPTGLYIID